MSVWHRGRSLKSTTFIYFVLDIQRKKLNICFKTCAQFFSIFIMHSLSSRCIPMFTQVYELNGRYLDENKVKGTYGIPLMIITAFFSTTSTNKIDKLIMRRAFDTTHVSCAKKTSSNTRQRIDRVLKFNVFDVDDLDYNCKIPAKFIITKTLLISQSVWSVCTSTNVESVSNVQCPKRLQSKQILLIMNTHCHI